MDALSYFALAVLFLVVLIIAYGMIAIHDIPYLIAKARNHPHQEAIHVGGWVSLFTLHAIWPFLWLWATIYHPEGGYSGKAKLKAGADDPNSGATHPLPAAATQAQITALEKKIAELETAFHAFKTSK